MIERHIKQSLGQMMHGVQVIGCRTHRVDPPLQRAYTSHWVCQVSFEEPLLMASVSPKHDSFPIIDETGVFSVSILAGDQLAEGQYFSYPGRKFRHIAAEYLMNWMDDLPIVVGCIAALRCEVEEKIVLSDHHVFFARVTDVEPGRLREVPLLYSSRLGWRLGSEKAREAGRSIRDELLQRMHPSESDEHDDDLDDVEF